MKNWSSFRVAGRDKYSFNIRKNIFHESHKRESCRKKMLRFRARVPSFPRPGTHLLRSLPILSILARSRTAPVSIIHARRLELHSGCKIRGRANCTIRHRANHVKSHFFFFFLHWKAHPFTFNPIISSSCNIMHLYIQKCTRIYHLF